MRESSSVLGGAPRSRDESEEMEESSSSPDFLRRFLRAAVLKPPRRSNTGDTGRELPLLEEADSDSAPSRCPLPLCRI